jgi:hypothetical protein
LQVLQQILKRLGSRSWIYREGRNRKFWVLETTAPFLSLSFDARQLVGSPEGLDYVRGYFFDADGGMPRHPSRRLYFQFAQKNRASLEAVVAISQAPGSNAVEFTIRAYAWIQSTGDVSSESLRTGDS